MMISTVLARRLPVLVVAVAITLLFHPVSARSADPPGQASSIDTVTIKAERERQLRRQVNDYVHGAAVTYLYDSLERWNLPVCPAVGGLPRERGEFILARLTQIAKDVHAPIAGEHCKPNFVVAVTDDPDRLVAKWSKRYLSRFNTCSGMGYLNDFLHSKQVVRVYYNAGFHTGPGQDLASLEIMGVNLSSYYNSCVGGGAAGTRLSWGVQELASVIIVVDSRRMTNLNIGQLADYVAMVGLAQIRPGGDTGSAPTILGLFGKADPPPEGLSPWDQSFLHGLYTADPSSVMQVSVIKRAMFEQMAGH